jgi:predicted amidohydrolase YtcJ
VAPGFLADLVVLGGNPFEGDAALAETRVDETWFDGACVHRRPTT